MIPVRASLCILVDFLRSKDARKAISVGNDARHVLGMLRVDEVNLAQLAQRAEVGQEILVAQGAHIVKVQVHIGNELDCAICRDALALEMLAYGREEAQPNLAVEHVQHGLVGRAGQHLVWLETSSTMRFAVGVGPMSDTSRDDFSAASPPDKVA